MSGWTVINARGVENREYNRSRWDDTGRSDACSDIARTFEEDSRVRKWKSVHGEVVCAYLACERYDWDFAEELLEDYDGMVDDAVVLGANDTTDTGTARYYIVDGGVVFTDEYKERQSQDGTYVGDMALQVVGSRHGFVARDPFHEHSGWSEDHWEKNGNVIEEAIQE